MSPRYPHECKMCKFLGTSGTADLYYCPSHSFVLGGDREAIAYRNHRKIHAYVGKRNWHRCTDLELAAIVLAVQQGYIDKDVAEMVFAGVPVE